MSTAFADTIAAPSQLHVPDIRMLIGELRELGDKIDAVGRVIHAAETNIFMHPDGRQEVLGDICLRIDQLALVAHYAKHCPTVASAEVGFGLGTSALLNAAVRAHFAGQGQTPQHWVFDPYGIGDKGKVIEDYLTAEYGHIYRRVWETSEVGLGQMQTLLGRGSVGFLLIDGSHRFENVLADFLLSDALCPVGGIMVLDDYAFPGVEAAVNYLVANRPDYIFNTGAADNTAICEKIAEKGPAWGEFKPFAVPDREDWNRAPKSNNFA